MRWTRLIGAVGFSGLAVAAMASDIAPLPTTPSAQLSILVIALVYLAKTVLELVTQHKKRGQIEDVVPYEIWNQHARREEEILDQLAKNLEAIKIWQATQTRILERLESRERGLL